MSLLIHPRRYYLDTNCLLFARHYLACEEKGVVVDLHPEGARSGKQIIESLEAARHRRHAIDIITSYITRFEMNQRYRYWLAKELFVEENVPVEAVDGRPRELMNVIMNKLPEVHRNKYNTRIAANINWLDEWLYADVVDVKTPNIQIFDVADPMQLWAPRITLLDSLHVATALLEGAHYFVTNDDDLRKCVSKIAAELNSTGMLPTGDRYDPPIEAINVPTLVDKIQSTHHS